MNLTFEIAKSEDRRTIYYKNKGKNIFFLHEAEIIRANPSSMTGSPNGVDTVNEFTLTDSIFNPTENVNSNLKEAESKQPSEFKPKEVSPALLNKY